MKKLFLLLAVASLALISCNKDENEDTQSQQQTITLHASVDLSNPETRVAPNASELDGSTVNFHWEEGDQVTISNNSESSTFTVKASTINGNSADFEGVALSDMSNYTVSYNQNATTVAYTDGTFKPVCSGTGNNTNFYINTFQPVIKLQLTGSVTLGKIEYWTGATPALTTTLTFSGGLTLTSTAQTVYFPVTAASTSGLTFKFYDNNATTPELIMEKTTSSNVSVGKITTFPELEVKKPKIVLLSGDFSVSSAGKKVKFTNGNLYYSSTDDAFHIEANQTDYPSSWDAGHVGHFFWTNLTDYQSGNASYMPYAASYSYSAQSSGDKFFCGEDNPLTVDGQSGLYALSLAEWNYLFKRRTNASSLYKYGVTVGSVTNCLIIAPDNYSGTALSAITDWSLSNINALGLVCLPAAGSRNGSSLSLGGDYGYQWFATLNGSNGAFILYFGSSGVYPTDNVSPRDYGYSVRLVCTAQ